MPLDTVLCLDTSGSMGWNNNEGINQLKAATRKFLEGVEETAKQAGLKENVGIVEFGANTRVLHNLSTNYFGLKLRVAGLQANGVTPMKDGLLMALKEIASNGGVVEVNGRKLSPRIILMTDGKPTDWEGRESEQALKEVLAVAVLFGPRWQEIGLPHKTPIACVGCGNADKKLLENIAKLTGGMYVMVQNVDELSTFFRRQVLLSRFIGQFAHDMAKLHSLLALRQFMQGLGEDMDDDELRPLMALLLAMIVNDDDDEEEENFPKPPPLGTRVRRGPHWKWGDQDGRDAGTVVDTTGTAGWVEVEWDGGRKNLYRYGKDGALDIRIVDEPRRVLLPEGVQVGVRVIRGPSWKWGEQDGGAGNIGRVFQVEPLKGVVKVRWPNGNTNTYRDGAEGARDLLIHPADVMLLPSFVSQGTISPVCNVM